MGRSLMPGLIIRAGRRTGRAFRGRAMIAGAAFVLAAAAMAMNASPALAVTAAASSPLPSVGAVFYAGSTRHSCTASVVHSPGHDLVLTAAHCVRGDGTTMRFAPGYHDGVSPYGRWTVTRAYLTPAWLNRRDWQHDYAILRVAPHWWSGRRHNVEDVVGANRLGWAPVKGRYVRVTGYVAGSGDKPITCHAVVYYTSTYPSFDCGGYRGGTSGSPWVHFGVIHGVIGGLHYGGCYEYTSYTSTFGAATARLWQRAVDGGPGDVAPPAGSDGC